MKMRKKLQTRDKSWGSKTSFLNVSQKKKKEEERKETKKCSGAKNLKRMIFFSVLSILSGDVQLTLLLLPNDEAWNTRNEMVDDFINYRFIV